MFSTLDSIAGAQQAGFSGFMSVKALREERLESVPAMPGVYVIIWPHESTPTFLGRSTAGPFKDRDPSLLVDEIVAAWVARSAVLYIGKAGGPGTRATLRSRLSAYLRHGQGRRASHWGGRAIWQLSDADALVVAWRVVDNADPRVVEREMLQSFVARHRKRPFANRTG